MSLNIKQIEHIARLARLELSDAEKKKFTKQIGDVLDYFKKLKELDTTNIPVTSQSIDLKNICRIDEIKGSDETTQKKILSNAPEKSGEYIKVNKIL